MCPFANLYRVGAPSQERKSVISTGESGEDHGEFRGVSPFFSSIDHEGRTDQDERMDPDESMAKDELKKDVAGKPKPIPIREIVGEPGPRSAGNSHTGADAPTSRALGPRARRERPEGPRRTGTSRRSERGRRRRPDRKAAPSGREKPQRPSLERTSLEDLPFRTFEHDGCEWIVRLCGQASTGSAMDPGAPLMHLVFYAADAPDVACGDLLETGRSLDGLPDLELPELLAKARLAASANDASR